MSDNRIMTQIAVDPSGVWNSTAHNVRITLAQWSRNQAADEIKKATPSQAESWQSVRAIVNEKMGTVAQRRRAELQLADYIDHVVLPVAIDTRLFSIPDAMRT